VRQWVDAVADPGRASALVAIHPATGQVLERFPKASEIVKFLPWLRHLNAKGFGIYASANMLAPGARRRRRSEFPFASALYLDLDRDGRESLLRIRRILPQPSLVVETSPWKFQILWRLEAPVPRVRAEGILRGLARAFGGDPAATDAARLLRLPGFTNTKYPKRPAVDLLELGPRAPVEIFDVYASAPMRTPDAAPLLEGTRVTAAAPPAEITGRPDLLRAWCGENPMGWERPATASERDFFIALVLLRHGVPPARVGEILATSPNRARGRVKRDLPTYLARTLARASASL
jgi:hypothetical protein